LPGLASNHYPPDVCLLSSLDYRREPPVPHSVPLLKCYLDRCFSKAMWMIVPRLLLKFRLRFSRSGVATEILFSKQLPGKTSAASPRILDSGFSKVGCGSRVECGRDAEWSLGKLFSHIPILHNSATLGMFLVYSSPWLLLLSPLKSQYKCHFLKIFLATQFNGSHYLSVNCLHCLPNSSHNCTYVFAYLL
jgi:hypothetical protein